ncbi:MAG: biotin-requiring enzyme [Selenomonadales bacterium]|nr:biotin-requiring enzyme [Selenomonadales bacterium]
MLKRKIRTGLLAAVMTLISLSPVFAAHFVDEASVLKGKVISVAQVGQIVAEGDELARVETLTGSMAAARATVNGTVAEVYVKVGETVEVNGVVAQIAVE